MLAINDLILKKINNLTASDKMKEILQEVLEAEEQMRILNDKNYKSSLGRILERYANEPDVKEFCSKYDS